MVATGGRGSGASLASQSGIARAGDLLVVVNAGDNTVSALAITGRGLVLRDVESSGGLRPVSVSVHDGIVYVLNHDSDTVSGLRLSRSGRLSPLPGSTRTLSPNPAGGLSDAAQVAFTPSGGGLVVTQRATNTIETFAVHGAYLGVAAAHASAGVTPYGFDFDRRGDAIVSEATTGSVSSYRIGRHVRVISAAVPDTQAGSCWLVVTRDGRYGYTVNAASASISSYRIGPDGRLTLSAAVAAGTGAGPTDATLARAMISGSRPSPTAAWRRTSSG